MTKSIKLILAMVVFAVVAIAIFLLVSYQKTLVKESFQLDYAQPREDFEIKIPKEKTWFSGMKKEKDFAYPASEVGFSIKFIDPNETKKTHRVIIKDVYEELLFCLKEVFKDKGVEFAYNKTPTNLDIIVYLVDGKEDEILKTLRYYNITYQNN
ncbi:MULTISPECIES: hypothetical protein [unclassified Helicobacter]|uniref:hypothetical protein n=1 Tax=unclassified Helicobacter TaxID=2593540 RepID=UPI000CF0F580|nr:MULTISPECIES: hypothetical protein [unclassified Helicobacter]